MEWIEWGVFFSAKGDQGQFDEFFPFIEVAAIAADDLAFEVADDGNGLRGFHR